MLLADGISEEELTDFNNYNYDDRTTVSTKILTKKKKQEEKKKT